MKTKLAKITLATSLNALILSATFLSCMSLIPQTAKAETTQHASTQITTNQAKEITPLTTDEIIYTTAQGLAVKKQNATLYITINNTQYEVLGQGSGAYDGYSLLEYAKATGSQYIDTGFTPNNNTSVEMKGSFQSINNNEAVFYGAGYSSGNRALECYMWDYKLEFNHGSQITFTYACAINEIYIIKQNSGKAYVQPIDGTEYSYTCSGGTFTAPCTMQLFTAHRTGTTQVYSQATIYYFKMWNNGTLIRDYVAAKRNSDSVVGMFDVLNMQFYAPSGTLIAGPIIAGYENKYLDPSPAGQAIAQNASKRQISGIDFYPGVETGYLLCKNSAGEYLQVLI